MPDPRIYPLIDVSREQLQALVGAPIAGVERVEGGLTNTIHKVRLGTGETLAVKHYAGGVDSFGAELATLTLLHGTLPVPDVVHADEAAPVIVYRWIDGISLDELRRAGPPEAFASIAEPLGRLLAWLARTDATEAFELTPILERCYAQLTTGRARERLGGPLADAIRKGLEAAEPTLSWGTVCLSHGDLGGRNLIVQRATGDRWRINGVIDWEATTTGSPLADLGSLFRHAHRFDPAWIEAFERGYREADGELPEGWLRIARLLDATWQVDTLDEPRELPGVFADCKELLARLAADLASESS
ncbi:MAG: phosphotransferase family protein [Kofleriaceae bacterium]